jgi:hypothetical protein
MIDDECWAVSGMRIGRGKRGTRRKPVPVSLCTPQIPHNLTRARTLAAAVGIQRLPSELWRGPYYNKLMNMNLTSVYYMVAVQRSLLYFCESLPSSSVKCALYTFQIFFVLLCGIALPAPWSRRGVLFEQFKCSSGLDISLKFVLTVSRLPSSQRFPHRNYPRGSTIKKLQ